MDLDLFFLQDINSTIVKNKCICVCEVLPRDLNFALTLHIL